MRVVVYGLSSPWSRGGGIFLDALVCEQGDFETNPERNGKPVK